MMSRRYKSMADKKKVFDNLANKNGLVRMHWHIKDELNNIEQIENIDNSWSEDNEKEVPETEAVISFLIDEYWKRKTMDNKSKITSSEIIDMVANSKSIEDAPSGECPLFECPFCRKLYVGGAAKYTEENTMSLIDHEDWCVYIKAKEYKGLK